MGKGADGDPIAENLLVDLLNRTGTSLINGGFEGFASCFHLPQTLATADGLRRITTRAELEQFFYELRGYYHEVGVKMLTRQPLTAQFVNEQTIVTVHKSFVIGKEGLMRDPFEVMTILQRKGDSWGASFSDSALGSGLEDCILKSDLRTEGAMPLFNPPIIRASR